MSHLSTISYSERRLFAMACKSLPKDSETIRWARRYEAISVQGHYSGRLSDALSYRPETSAEKLQLEEIVRHRRILSECVDQVELCKTVPCAVQDTVLSLQRRIERLSSQEALFDEREQRHFFCIPGGSATHSVVYGFAKEQDGTYTFLVFNKGIGGSDADLHGTVAFKHQEDTIFRSRVQIRGLKKGDLQDADFLKDLILLQNSAKKMGDVYQRIKGHLLATCKGWVRKAPEESVWQSLMKQPFLTAEENQLRLQLQERMRQDRDFHPAQHFATCVESNAQMSEGFADPLFRKKLKLHSLQNTSASSVSDPLLKQRVREKIESLKQKIQERKPCPMIPWYAKITSSLFQRLFYYGN